jgi:hypothetical protein
VWWSLSRYVERDAIPENHRQSLTLFIKIKVHFSRKFIGLEKNFHLDTYSVPLHRVDFDGEQFIGAEVIGAHNGEYKSPVLYNAPFDFCIWNKYYSHDFWKLFISKLCSVQPKPRDFSSSKNYSAQNIFQAKVIIHSFKVSPLCWAFPRGQKFIKKTKSWLRRNQK